MKKTYWIDVDINGKQHINDWRANNKAEAIEQMVNYYLQKDIPQREIIIRKITNMQIIKQRERLSQGK